MRGKQATVSQISEVSAWINNQILLQTGIFSGRVASTYTTVDSPWVEIYD
jgi:hypothetical protein